jgi:hypothetical protein
MMEPLRGSFLIKYNQCDLRFLAGARNDTAFEWL